MYLSERINKAYICSKYKYVGDFIVLNWLQKWESRFQEPKKSVTSKQKLIFKRQQGPKEEFLS